MRKKRTKRKVSLITRFNKFLNNLVNQTIKLAGVLLVCILVIYFVTSSNWTFSKNRGSPISDTLHQGIGKWTINLVKDVISW